MRIALGLEYDGSAFAGWQTQSARDAVQDAVEDALREFSGVPMATVCAGRTDAGVHARGQVIHLDTTLQRPSQAWVRGVNRYLPRTIAVRWSCDVPQDFHARFSAVERCYDYWLLNDPVRSPLLDRRVGWVFRPLALVPMQEAAQILTGRHDFSSFRAADCQAATPVRELRELSIERFGRLIRVRAVAHAFLHHMVRNLVGTLVYIGVGRRPANWAAEILAARDRRAAAPTFTAAGLYLARVQYDPRFALPTPEREYELIASAP